MTLGRCCCSGETHSEIGGRKEYVCLLHPPTARGADLKNHGCSGGDTDAKPTLPPVPFFPAGGLGAQGGHLVACAVQVTVARGQPARDLAPGGGKLWTARCGFALGARGVPFPLRLSRPRGVGLGFPPRASCVCARTARFCAQGALWDPRLTASLGSQGSRPVFPGL